MGIKQLLRTGIGWRALQCVDRLGGLTDATKRIAGDPHSRGDTEPALTVAARINAGKRQVQWPHILRPDRPVRDQRRSSKTWL